MNKAFSTSVLVFSPIPVPAIVLGIQHARETPPPHPPANLLASQALTCSEAVRKSFPHNQLLPSGLHTPSPSKHCPQ